jgi:acetyl esterase/lipase
MKFATAVLGFLVLPIVSLAQSNYPPEMSGARVETFRSIDDVDLRVWIFDPDGHDASQSRAAVVFFFGGGFRAGTPAQFQNQARYLASRGMVAIAADYRVFNRNGTTIGVAVNDAKASIRWVRRHAGRLGVDPNRIAAAGGSAGGHLAASTALLPEFDSPSDDADIRSTPDALALFNPVVITAAVPGSPDIDPLGDSAELRGEASRESLSPYHHVGPGSPPTIIFHGTDDSTAPYSHVELFTGAMRAADNQCELVGYEGEDHGFFNYGRGDGSAYEDTLRRIDAFFVSLGWLTKP